MARKNLLRRKARRPATAAPKDGADLDALLYRLNQGIALVATACRAMEGIEDEAGHATPLDVADQILALSHGVGELRGVYDALDTAVSALRATP
jgi:hypothetical protein